MKTNFAVLSVCLLSVPALASEAVVTKSHLCCPGCVKAVESTLGKVEGLSNVSVDQDARSIRFEAADKKTARAGLRALSKAGFGGEAKVDGKLVKPPAPNIEEGATASEVKMTQVHLCCGACVKAVEGAVSKVQGVAAVTCDREKGTCVATGENVSVLGVLQALRDAGFNGTIPGQRGKQANQKNKKKNAS